MPQPLYRVNVSLDGCVHHEAGRPPDAELMAFWTDELRRSDRLLYGRVTYELMEGAWRRPASGRWPDWMDASEVAFAGVMDPMQKVVASGDTVGAMDWLAFWLTLLSIVVTVVGIVVGLMTLKRRRAALHWTTPSWNVKGTRVGTTIIPTLTPQWRVRGAETIHGVECAVRSPGSPLWRVSSWPGGEVRMNQALYVHINMLNGALFTATVASPGDHGKPVSDRTSEALKGEYRLRIRWFESATPQKQRQKIFKHAVR